MKFLSKLLKLLVLFVLCSSKQCVRYTHKNVFAGTNETVVLNCYRIDEVACAWRISKKAVPSAKESNETDKTYTLHPEGHSLNPKLKTSNIDIIGGSDNKTCKLKIRSFSAADEGIYTCKYLSSGTFTLAKRYNVQLKSLPSNLTIHGLIMTNGRKVVRGVEGTKLTIVCTVKRGRSAATLRLSTAKVSIETKKTNRITYSIMPTKNENLQSIACSVNSAQLAEPLSVKVLLDIQYSPVVEIKCRPTNRKLVLICNPSGNPDNYTFGNWEHWSEFKEYIRTLEGSPDGKLRFMKSNKDKRLHETDGKYTCKASNGIYGTNGHVYQKGTELVHMKVPPIFVNANTPIQFGRYGQKMNLTVILYNNFGIIQATISKQNEPLYTETIQEKIRTQDIFHDVNVTVSGIKITFHLTLNTEEDFTDYTVKTCNKMGCNKLTVKITSEDRPEAPTNMSVIPFERHLTVLWYRGYNGGFPQTFFIEYRPEKKKIWRRSDPVIDNMQARLSHNLFNLSSQTRYLVRVVSANVIGEGDKTAVTLIMTSAIHSTVEQSASDHGIVIVVLVLVSIVVGAGIGVFVRYLKKKTKKRMTTAANVRASEANNDNSIIYEDIVKDDNYQTSSQENKNWILTKVHIIADDKISKDTASLDNALVASDRIIEDVDNDDGIYDLSYTSLVVKYCADVENVNLITNQDSIYENETSLDDSAYEVSPELLKDTSLEEQELPIYENFVEEEVYLNYIVNDIE